MPRNLPPSARFLELWEGSTVLSIWPHPLAERQAAVSESGRLEPPLLWRGGGGVGR